jgi:PRC-barrel domain protein
MLKTLMMTTTALALVVGSAVAQSPAPDTPKAPPMQKSETMPAPGATGSRQFITQQSPDQWLATKFKGTDVIGSNNEKIGDVNDLLIDQNGRIMAYIVGVGGFLGIGQKDVALAPAAFQVQPATDREALKLKLAMTRDELKNAPEFKAAAARPAPTTGQAPPRERAPATPPAAAPTTPPAPPAK